MTDAPRDDDLTYVHDGMGTELDTVLVFSLLRTHSYLGPFIDEDLRRQNLTSAQLNTLLVLRAAGAEGLLMGEIGRRLVVTKANVTGLIDRLERQGLVAARRERRPPGDRGAADGGGDGPAGPDHAGPRRVACGPDRLPDGRGEAHAGAAAGEAAARAARAARSAQGGRLMRGGFGGGMGGMGGGWAAAGCGTP